MIRKSIAGMVLTALVCYLPLRATSLDPLNLVDLTKLSSRIFEGRCVERVQTSVRSSGGKYRIPAVRYTFEVVDALKGVSAQTIVLQQLGHDDDFFIKPEFLDLPSFEIGATYFLFMDKDGSTGLTSPLGMRQGVFDVQSGLARNRVGNRYILLGMEKALRPTVYHRLWRESQTDLRAKNKGGKDQTKGLDVQLLKALVRDLLAGTVKAPARKELAR